MTKRSRTHRGDVEMLGQGLAPPTARTLRLVARSLKSPLKIRSFSGPVSTDAKYIDLFPPRKPVA